MKARLVPVLWFVLFAATLYGLGWLYAWRVGVV